MMLFSIYTFMKVDRIMTAFSEQVKAIGTCVEKGMEKVATAVATQNADAAASSKKPAIGAKPGALFPGRTQSLGQLRLTDVRQAGGPILVDHANAGTVRETAAEVDACLGRVSNAMQNTASHLVGTVRTLNEEAQRINLISAAIQDALKDV
jgi:hypothetical protein